VDRVYIEKVDETYSKIVAEPSIIMEMSDHFTFEVPGAKFTPAFKARVWDGRIRLLNTMTCLLYAGLNRYVEEFCKSRGYEFELSPDFNQTVFSIKECSDFIKELAPSLEPRDYQIDAFIHAVRENRSLLLSPTASGKSFIIYLLMRYYSKKTLIIVPTTSLVSQLSSDFSDYGFDSKEYVHRIFSGQDKQTDKPITISTWQSIYKMDKKYFSQFDVVIGDEAHLFKAKSLTSIMSKLDQCKYRFGFTGTLDGTETNRLVLEGLFGPVRKVITTKELIDNKHLADFKIKCIVLSYPDEIRKLASKYDYQEEMDFLVRCEQRNKFIQNLALSLEGNTLLLFQYVDKHGKVLYNNLLKEAPDKKLYYVSGSVSGDDRENIRKEVDKSCKFTYKLEFPEYVLSIREGQKIPLVDRTEKNIENITEDDDIDTGICINRIRESIIIGNVKWTTKKSTIK
jgi:superfamily II DNA or RNA helicase